MDKDKLFLIDMCKYLICHRRIASDLLLDTNEQWHAASFFVAITCVLSGRLLLSAILLLIIPLTQRLLVGSQSYCQSSV
jgi:hypothetical protein